MRTILACLILLSTLPCLAQIRSAEERIRREQNNSRPAITADQVAAQKIDLAGRVFNLQIHYCLSTKLVQIESNRWELNIGDERGVFAAVANIPRAGAEVIDTIQDGDVVVARIKEGSPFIIEILGVSEVGVWK